MLEDVYLDQSVVSNSMISIKRAKFIDRIVEVRKPVLYHNEKDTPMYGAITENCDDVKKVVGEAF